MAKLPYRQMRCLLVIDLAKSSTLATPVVGASRIFSSDESCFISTDSDDSDDVDSFVSTCGCGVDIVGRRGEKNGRGEKSLEKTTQRRCPI